MLCAHIDLRFHGNVVLLDVGASDGVTTVEVARTLRSALGDRVHCYIADINLWLFRYRKGPFVEYRARDGEPIMMRVGFLGLRLSKSRRGMNDSHDEFFIRQYLSYRSLRKSMVLDGSISLVNPISSAEPDIEAIEFDCLSRNDSLINCFSAVRASNVLNLGYFDIEQIQRAIGHLHSYVRDGGCLVISRNSDDINGETENGSVWIKEPDHFRWVEDFGSGSEVRELVDHWTTRTTGCR
jgi:hypothetical protein